VLASRAAVCILKKSAASLLEAAVGGHHRDMSTDLNTLADTLRTQLGSLSNGASVAGSDGSIEVQLTPDAAQALSAALASHHASSESSAEDQEWNAVSERVSEIEGFTGGESGE
jgi:hypothetical protein